MGQWLTEEKMVKSGDYTPLLGTLTREIMASYWDCFDKECCSQLLHCFNDLINLKTSLVDLRATIAKIISYCSRFPSALVRSCYPVLMLMLNRTRLMQWTFQNPSDHLNRSYMPGAGNMIPAFESTSLKHQRSKPSRTRSCSSEQTSAKLVILGVAMWECSP